MLPTKFVPYSSVIALKSSSYYSIKKGRRYTAIPVEYEDDDIDECFVHIVELEHGRWVPAELFKFDRRRPKIKRKLPKWW